MPSAIKRHKLQMLKPRVRVMGSIVEELLKRPSMTLREKQEANGRTLALNGAAWRRLRAHVLAEQPLCPDCQDEGYIVPAMEVDHVDNDPTNNDRDNLVGLCKSHHSQKTARDMGGKPRRGCDAHGMPLDPSHPWKAAQRAENRQQPTGREPSGPLRARDRA